MPIHRRDVLCSLGGLAATAAFPAFGARVPGTETPPAGGPAAEPTTLPRKSDFLIEDGYTYLNAAYTHPIPKVSVEAARRAAEGRGSLRAPAAGGRSGTSGAGSQNANPRTLFAELINAKPTEIAYVSCTSAGENLVVQALGLDHGFDGNVVTDGLHFEGALLHLLELKKQGLDVRVVKPTKDFRIDFKDLESVVDRKTKLIEVSSASMYNGFQHDLKAVCDLAHAHGAYVYADVIHSAGADPFDVKASGVDFAACSTFKWLMGDFGLGFLYAREDVLDRIRRPVASYYQAGTLEAFYPPNIPDGDYAPIAYDLQKTAAGMFETGTLTGSTEINVALLTASLNYVRELGVANIQAHRQPLVRKLQQEVPRLGFTPVTPPESTGGNVTFAKTNIMQSEIPRKLQAAKVNVRLDTHWMRLSPSVYNDMSDVDRFLDALS
jgi:selenocysteine lyase/cysteine desulfurase